MELRGRNYNEALHTPSIRQLPPGPICAQSTVQTLDKNLCLPLPISQSTSASFSTISPKSNSDLDTDQGEIINATPRKVVQTFSQTLLRTTAGSPTSNLDSNNVPHDNTLDTQSASTLDTNDIQKQTIPPPKDAYNLDPANNIRTNLISNFEEKKIIMDRDALSHSTKLHYKILQELNLNGLCQYSNSHKEYIF